MTFQYSLDKNDFVEYYLFNTSMKESIIYSRKKNRYSFTTIYIFLGIVMFLVQYYFVAFTFIGVAIAWYLFYPKYIRKKYFQHFTNHVNENYTKNFDKPTTITFNDDYIETIDEMSENKYWNKAFEEITEINDYYFFKFLNGGALIIHKKSIPDHAEFQKYLLKLTQNYDIKHQTYPSWTKAKF